MHIYKSRRITNMERNLDFLREILLRVESDRQLDGYHFRAFDASDFPGHTRDDVAYHVDVLVEAGLLKEGGTTMGSPSTSITRLTWAGHEFLDSIKDAGIWTKVKARVAGLPAVALGVVAAIGEAEIKKHLGM
jgi:hypothetical protein